MTDMAVVNAIVHKEILLQQARRRAKSELDRTARAEEERRLNERIAELNRKYNREPNRIQSAWKVVTDAWELFWAVVFLWPEMLINLCIEKGLIEKYEE